MGRQAGRRRADIPGRTILQALANAMAQWPVPLRRAPLALLLGLVLAVSGLPGSGGPLHGPGSRPALAREAYTAPPVPIEAEAASPADARDKAIAAGGAAALRALLESLTNPADHGRLPPIDAARADAMVVDFSLSGERTTATRYLATLTARFNASMVDALLAQAGLGHVAPREAPVLILPVYQSGPSADPLLWEETNPWAQAWGEAPDLSDGLVPVILALGDLADLTTLDARRALDGDVAATGRLAARYGAPEALVIRTEGSRETGLTVSPDGQGVFSDLDSFSLPAGEDVFAQAVARVRAALNDAWKAQTLGLGGPSGSGPAPGALWTGPGGATAPAWTAAGDGLWTGGATTAEGTAGSAAGAGAAAMAGAGTLPADATGAPQALAGLPGGPQAQAQAPGTGGASQDGPAGAVTLLARYGSLKDWVDIRRRLQGIPGTGSMGLQAVTAHEAQIHLTYPGSMVELQRILFSRGLRMTESRGVWVVEPITGAPAGGFPGMTPAHNRIP